MIEVDADVAILGSGFGGSLLALILNRIGLQVVLIDRNSHPRFAIGESSTPIANMVLRDLARRYDLPRLEPLTKYGTAREAYPQLTIGLKRGFSYFKHEPGRPFEPHADHRNELLVAASADDRIADTHWLRADVDQFFYEEVKSAEIPTLDQTSIAELRRDRGWTILGERNDEPVRIKAGFLVDASGESGVVPRSLGIPTDATLLKTNSRCIFGHYVGVRSWHASAVRKLPDT